MTKTASPPKLASAGDLRAGYVAPIPEKLSRYEFPQIGLVAFSIQFPLTHNFSSLFIGDTTPGSMVVRA